MYIQHHHRVSVPIGKSVPLLLSFQLLVLFYLVSLHLIVMRLTFVSMLLQIACDSYSAWCDAVSI